MLYLTDVASWRVISMKPRTNVAHLGTGIALRDGDNRVVDAKAQTLCGIQIGYGYRIATNTGPIRTCELCKRFRAANTPPDNSKKGDNNDTPNRR